MGGPSIPSYIFTVRHGARLDAADSNWHLTSPTAYDPPITYGGWIQGRSLGYKIASILDSRKTTPSPSASTTNLSQSEKTPALGGGKPKKTRILIHTSPFLRCIQTSIAISAGIAMHWTKQQQTAYANGDYTPRKYNKPLLRVDAWLGEWLAPDYFTEVSPPPEMAILSATAKADLMRPSSAHAIRSSIQSPLNSFSSDLADSLPPLPGYMPPVPSYAITANGPIPRGYVSHAKEYLEIDYPWDSTKFGPGGEYGEEWASMHKRFKKGYRLMLSWFGEHDAEITSEKTMWGKPMAKSGGSASASSPEKKKAQETVDDDDESDIEIVVILVTHGAGCNALIGAMTDRPVLMDIGLASMTMAQRSDKPAVAPKPQLKTAYSAGIIPPPKPCPITDCHGHNFWYDVKVMASTEHLRRESIAAMNSSIGSNSPKLAGMGRDTPPPLSILKSRFIGNSPGAGSGGSDRRSAAISTISENDDVPDYSPNVSRRTSISSTSSSPGLWSRPTTSNGTDDSGVSPAASRRDSTTDKFIDRERLNRGRGGRERSLSARFMHPPTIVMTTADGTEADDSENAAGSEESDDADTPGLWGERKRRWTMDQANRGGQGGQQVFAADSASRGM